MLKDGQAAVHVVRNSLIRGVHLRHFSSLCICSALSIMIAV